MNLAHRGNRACLPSRGLHPLLKRGSPSLTLLTQQEPHPARHKILDSQFSSWRELTLDPQFSFHCGLVISTEAKEKRKKKKKKGVTGLESVQSSATPRPVCGRITHLERVPPSTALHLETLQVAFNLFHNLLSGRATLAETRAQSQVSL